MNEPGPVEDRVWQKHLKTAEKLGWCIGFLRVLHDQLPHLNDERQQATKETIAEKLAEWGETEAEE